MYNDEPPMGPVTLVKGHTKGVMAGNEQSGFWLVHSVPHFPPDLSSGQYGYPKTGHMYGQSFLCVTLDAANLNRAAEQLLFNEPEIYSAAAPIHLQ